MAMEDYPTKYLNLLKQYEVLERIGEGGEAEVFRCRRIKDGKEFACKTTLNYVKSEEKIMRKLSTCPGVVRLEEVIEEKTSVWHFVMELCECSLEDRFKDKGKLSEAEGAILIRNLAKSIKDLHAKGVIHRDLKAANILISLGGKPYDVKVSDFGDSVCFSWVRPYFKGDLMVGTPRYYAPEVLVKLMHPKYSKKVDIWGLGLILYEALSGKYPFFSLTTDEVTDMTCHGEDLRSHLDFPPGISSLAKELVLAMLHPNPKKRISLQRILCHPWVLQHSLEHHSSKGHIFPVEIAKAMHQFVCSRARLTK